MSVVWSAKAARKAIVLRYRDTSMVIALESGRVYVDGHALSFATLTEAKRWLDLQAVS